MTSAYNNITKTIYMLCLSLALTACIKPYQPNIQQGNILNNSDLQELSYGMSKQEVLFILGTPMIIDPFNESRWDYFYSKTNQLKNHTAQRLVTAIFKGNELVELAGDVNLASLKTLEPSIEDMQHGGTIITEPTRRQKGFLSRMFNKRKTAKQRRAAKKNHEK